jgi:hypothetical protein
MRNEKLDFSDLRAGHICWSRILFTAHTQPAHGNSMGRKRKRQKAVSDDDSSSKKASSLIDFHRFHDNRDLGKTSSESIPAAQRGACTRCKTKKVKCEYSADSSTCQKCTDAGLENFCQPGKVTSRKRSSSVVSNHSSRANDVESQSDNHFTSLSHTASSNRAASSNREASSNRVVSSDSRPLTTIAELPESSFEDENYADDSIISFQQFISDEPLHKAGSADSGEDNSDYDFGPNNGAESDGEEEISSSDDSEDLRELSRQLAMQKKKKPGPKPSSRQTQGREGDDTYDPRTCGMAHVLSIVVMLKYSSCL